MIILTRDEALFIADTLKAIKDKKARVGKKHYRTTINVNSMTNLINKLEEVEE